MMMKSIKDLKSVFNNINISSLNILYLQGNDIDIEKFMPGLDKVLKTVKLQIYIKGFMMGKADFIRIIESSSGCKELILSYCFISGFDQTLTLNPKLDYRIESLNLYGTCNKSNKESLNTSKVSHLLSSMSQTSLKSSLKSLITYEKWYPHKALQPLCDSYGFDLTVTGSTEEPKEIQ